MKFFILEGYSFRITVRRGRQFLQMRHKRNVERILDGMYKEKLLGNGGINERVILKCTSINEL
jgi:hypothetical protein